MSIRDRWASLTARERDAGVARAMGREVQWIASEEFKSEKDSTAPLGFTCNFGGAVYTSDREWLVDDFLDVEANRAVPHYSTSWADAGPLLDELLSTSATVEFDYTPADSFGPACVGLGVTLEGEATFDVTGATATECIALAYCVAKEKP